MDITQLISMVLKARAEGIMSTYEKSSKQEKGDFYAGVWSVFALASHHLIAAGVGDPVPGILEDVLAKFDKFRESE